MIIITKYDYDSNKDIMYNSNIITQYCQMINKIPLIESKEEEKKLFIAYHSGDIDSKKKLINANLRLVVSIAKNYTNYNVPFEDLIQEGNLALIKAVETFDYKKGNKLSTYATRCIKRKIIRLIQNQSKNIRVPVNLHSKIAKINKAVENYIITFGHKPSTEYIAHITNIPIEEINYINTHIYEETSLNKKIRDEENDDEIEQLLMDNNPEFAEQIIDNEIRNLLTNYMDKILTKKEKEAILVKYGFYDNDNKTLEETGKILNITRQAVEDLEKRALKKLRKEKSINFLKKIR